MRPTCGPPGADRTQVSPMWAHEPCYQAYNAKVQYWQVCPIVIQEELGVAGTSAKTVFGTMGRMSYTQLCTFIQGIGWHWMCVQTVPETILLIYLHLLWHGDAIWQCPMASSHYLHQCWLIINGWVNNGEAGDFRRYRTHYDVTVMKVREMTERWKLVK